MRILVNSKNQTLASVDNVAVKATWIIPISKLSGVKLWDYGITRSSPNHWPGSVSVLLNDENKNRWFPLQRYRD